MSRRRQKRKRNIPKIDGRPKRRRRRGLRNMLGEVLAPPVHNPKR